MDVLTLSGILGHAQVATTETFYLHPRQAAMHRAMAQVSPVAEIPAAAKPKKRTAWRASSPPASKAGTLVWLQAAHGLHLAHLARRIGRQKDAVLP